jgi:hypothetical protein
MRSTTMLMTHLFKYNTSSQLDVLCLVGLLLLFCSLFNRGGVESREKQYWREIATCIINK